MLPCWIFVRRYDAVHTCERAYGPDTTYYMHMLLAPLISPRNIIDSSVGTILNSTFYGKASSTFSIYKSQKKGHELNPKAPLNGPGGPWLIYRCKKSQKVLYWAEILRSSTTCNITAFADALDKTQTLFRTRRAGSVRESLRKRGSWNGKK